MMREMIIARMISAPRIATAPTTTRFCMTLAPLPARAIWRGAGDRPRDVDAERVLHLLEQRGHRRRVRGGVCRNRLAIAAVDQVDLADLDAAGGRRDLAEDLVEVLEHEHVHRAPTAVAPRVRDFVERLRHRLAIGRDRRGLAG